MKEIILKKVILVFGLAYLCVGELGAQPQSCRVVDLMPVFWKVVAETSSETTEKQVERFRAEMVQPNGDLYAATGFGFMSDSELDTAIPVAIANARAHGNSTQSMTAQIASRLPTLVEGFRRYFPDFRCSFPIYLAPSLGKLDGAGRIINRKPALVIGIDQAAAEYAPATLPVFLTHELFHRYHQQTAGFSDDEGDRSPIWRTLWAEGLATYVSMKLNPGVTLQEALILPKDLIAQAKPRLPELIADILPHLDQNDRAVFAAFFEYHRDRTAIPSRVGYYLGALIAQRLNSNLTLLDLAHLQPSATEKLEKQALGELQQAS